MMVRYCMGGCMVVLQTLAFYLTSRRKSELMNYSPNGTMHMHFARAEDSANSLLDGDPCIHTTDHKLY